MIPPYPPGAARTPRAAPASRFASDAAGDKPVMGDSVDDSIALAANPEAARRARAWIAEIGPPVTGRKLEEVQLVVSELVTNCLRHAGLAADDVIELCRRVVPGEKLRIEVVDRGPGFAPPEAVHMPAEGETGGRGLALVDRLASRWGVLNDEVHRVWCEFDRPEPEPAAAHADSRRVVG
jgi:anti-sigma regulatory factor (Ser/Thr protein kinase)